MKKFWQIWSRYKDEGPRFKIYIVSSADGSSRQFETMEAATQAAQEYAKGRLNQDYFVMESVLHICSDEPKVLVSKVDGLSSGETGRQGETA
jgi:hypothetical protein